MKPVKKSPSELLVDQWLEEGAVKMSYTDALSAVLEYAYETEGEHFEEGCPDPEDSSDDEREEAFESLKVHVFVALRVLKGMRDYLAEADRLSKS